MDFAVRFRVGIGVLLAVRFGQHSTSWPRRPSERLGEGVQTLSPRGPGKFARLFALFSPVREKNLTSHAQAWTLKLKKQSMAREFASGQDENLPDTSECRVMGRAMDSLCLCLNPSPQGCKHMKQFHLLAFCFHPNRSEFADRTEEEYGDGKLTGPDKQ